MTLLLALVEGEGEVVARDALIEQVWNGSCGADQSLSSGIARLRKIFGDSRASSSLIETVPKRGYRLVPAVRWIGTRPPQAAEVGPKPGRIVGRAKESAELHAMLDAARNRQGGAVLVTGEAGIGKTALIEGFLSDAAEADPQCRIGRGRCSERLEGTGAYLPFLEALQSLRDGPAGAEIRRLLETEAPGWYRQIAPHSGAAAPSRERLKLELAAFFRAATRSAPVILFFDDLQWADTSTVDLVGYLAAHFETMRLLIVVAYRKAEMLLPEHPFVALKLDLQGRGRCHELMLDHLSRSDVERFLGMEFGTHRLPPEFVDLLYRKSGGNPLFLSDLARYLRAGDIVRAHGDGWTLAQGVPDLDRNLPQSSRSVIERTIKNLGSADRHLLTAASVCGQEFLSSIAAQTADLPIADAEERLDALDRVHGLVERVREQVLPDGSCAVRYRFVHALYHDALYGSLMPARKAHLSAAVAACLQARFRGREAEIGSELALLLEAARDFSRAAGAFASAAQHAMGVHAYHEASVLAQRGLDMLGSIPQDAARDGQELLLQTLRGLAVVKAKGWAAPEVEAAYGRALEICRRSEERGQLFPVLMGLWLYHQIRGALSTADDLAQHLLRLAESEAEPTRLAYAHLAVAGTSMDSGRLGKALAHAQQAAAALAAGTGEGHDLFALHAGVVIPLITARTLWPLGYPEQAQSSVAAALARAREINQPENTAFALTYAANIAQLCGDPDGMVAYAEECAAIAQAHGLAQPLAWARFWCGWHLAGRDRRRGIAEMREAYDIYRATGSVIGCPQFLGLLAEALGEAGQADEGIKLLDEAIAMAGMNDGHYYEPELHRVLGRLLVQDRPSQVRRGEAAVERAVETARRQGARGWELRALTELCRLPANAAARSERRSMLEATLETFTEGLETRDLRTARRLLAESP